MKGSFSPRRDHNPQAKNHFLRPSMFVYVKCPPQLVLGQAGLQAQKQGEPSRSQGYLKHARKLFCQRLSHNIKNAWGEDEKREGPSQSGVLVASASQSGVCWINVSSWFEDVTFPLSHAPLWRRLCSSQTQTPAGCLSRASLFISARCSGLLMWWSFAVCSLTFAYYILNKSTHHNWKRSCKS